MASLVYDILSDPAPLQVPEAGEESLGAVYIDAEGEVNANRQLSVRTDGAWIMHVNDDLVAIQGNLRVHGAFRSDS
ncbi:hypothetical protein ACFWP3_02200 [Streptomyces sp. NPDC058525]|uniref:hypothetical protein n=1 Tax=Streptomyces sp. NPDC058525 TaxID=3346538 RepID=UPI003661AF61